MVPPDAPPAAAGEAGAPGAGPGAGERLGDLERFRALLDETSEAIFLLELPEGTVLDANGTAARLLGEPREALLGAGLPARLDRAAAEVLGGLLVGGAGAEGRPSLAAALRTAGGAPLAVELSVRPAWLGARAYAVVVARPTAERDEQQARLALADRLDSIGTLAAGVAHEVNNPLAYLVGNLDFARHELEALRRELAAAAPGVAGAAERLGEALAALEDAAGGAARVRRIVTDLKVFSRADEDQRAPLDVRQVLDGALTLAGGEIRRHARLARRYREVPLVLANERRLSQAFLGLVSNAAQAIPEGAADLHEVAVSTWTEGGHAVVEVRDTGVGIPEALLPRLFDPFFTTRPQGMGTGLGLAVCHGVVTQLGGAIDVRSQPGQGSAFRIRLPGLPAAAAAPPPGAPPPPARPPARILVVDDDPLAGSSLRRLLSPPHAVERCGGGREALDRLLAGETFDVVLCDLMLPGFTGRDLFQALLAVRPDQARRLILVTGGAFTPEARAFLAEGHCPTVDKPVSPKALLAAIDAVAPPA